MITLLTLSTDCKKQIFQTWICNYIQQCTLGYIYLSMDICIVHPSLHMFLQFSASCSFGCCFLHYRLIISLILFIIRMTNSHATVTLASPTLLKYTLTLAKRMALCHVPRVMTIYLIKEALKSGQPCSYGCSSVNMKRPDSAVYDWNSCNIFFVKFWNTNKKYLLLLACSQPNGLCL